MTPAERADRLRGAAAAVAAVAASLDRTYDLCDACRLPHYRDIVATRLGKELDALVGRLRRMADDFGASAVPVAVLAAARAAAQASGGKVSGVRSVSDGCRVELIDDGSGKVDYATLPHGITPADAAAGVTATLAGIRREIKTTGDH